MLEAPGPRFVSVALLDHLRRLLTTVALLDHSLDSRSA